MIQLDALRRMEGRMNLCSDCPPAGYPTDETRCDACPRCLPLCPDSPDGNHHVAPIGSDEEWMPSKAPCYYCGEKQAGLIIKLEAGLKG